MSSTLEEDNIIIPVQGTIRLEKSKVNKLLYLDIIYKNAYSNEWMILKKPIFKKGLIRIYYNSVNKIVLIELIGNAKLELEVTEEEDFRSLRQILDASLNATETPTRMKKKYRERPNYKRLQKKQRITFKFNKNV